MFNACLIVGWAALWVAGIALAHFAGASEARRAGARRCPGLKLWNGKAATNGDI